MTLLEMFLKSLMTQDTSYYNILTGKHRVPSRIFSMTSPRKTKKKLENIVQVLKQARYEQLMPVGSVMGSVAFFSFLYSSIFPKLFSMSHV